MDSSSNHKHTCVVKIINEKSPDLLTNRALKLKSFLFNSLTTYEKVQISLK